MSKKVSMRRTPQRVYDCTFVISHTSLERKRGMSSCLNSNPKSILRKLANWQQNTPQSYPFFCCGMPFGMIDLNSVESSDVPFLSKCSSSRYRSRVYHDRNQWISPRKKRMCNQMWWVSYVETVSLEGHVRFDRIIIFHLLVSNVDDSKCPVVFVVDWEENLLEGKYVNAVFCCPPCHGVELVSSVVCCQSSEEITSEKITLGQRLHLLMSLRENPHVKIDNLSRMRTVWWYQQNSNDELRICGHFSVLPHHSARFLDSDMRFESQWLRYSTHSPSPETFPHACWASCWLVRTPSSIEG